MAKSVVIVGGGSSGWMTASYLKKALKGVDITLVEAPHIKTIGVGEATFSTIKLFFDYLGLEEHEWMPSCNAAYKLAIKFVNWRKQGGHFYHPFQRYEMVDGYNAAEWWLKLKRGEEAFDYSCFTIPALCDAKRSPRYLDGRVFDEKVQNYFADGDKVPNAFLAEHDVQYPYAYHFDAGLLAGFLEKYATQRGVRKVEDEVIQVELSEDGNISQIITKEHGPIAADLFVDCSGFRGLLINQALKEPFISFSDCLLNDSAVALQVPVDIKSRGMEPFTSATALSAGWVWNIPLYGRIGTGYVYSSKFISKDEAEAEFRQYLGPMADNCRANHVKMRIGRNRNSWVKNCVAIGLSSGFVEPLESTGIFFIQHGIEELVRHFPGNGIDEAVVASYNRAVANAIDGVRDFLALHYCVSDRDDTPFWQAVRSELKVPDVVQERLELWKHRLPNSKSINSEYHGFENYSYSVMMLGLGHEPARSLPVLDHMDDRNALEMFRKVKERAQYLVATLPSQYEYLTHVRQRASRMNEPVAPFLYDDAGQLWKELVALNQPAV
ncbi:MAG TPA: tryptophan halogenase family protein [Thermoanaerobaculia bacterium]|jgi:tryptophan halogenase|nr:tryptophan halogenase family protein [Thermoanaerobaculia bacterium]